MYELGQLKKYLNKSKFFIKIVTNKNKIDFTVGPSSPESPLSPGLPGDPGGPRSPCRPGGP